MTRRVLLVMLVLFVLSACRTVSDGTTVERVESMLRTVHQGGYPADPPSLARLLESEGFSWSHPEGDSRLFVVKSSSIDVESVTMDDFEGHPRIALIRIMKHADSETEAEALLNRWLDAIAPSGGDDRCSERGRPIAIEGGTVDLRCSVATTAAGSFAQMVLVNPQFGYVE